jgi:fermentation-respiration switch protein FrsA (DUF1100 family)
MARSATREPAATPREAAPREAALRLTRRGRFVLLLLLTAISAGLGALVATSSGAAPRAVDAPVTVVRPNDTLWLIATREFPNRDPFEAIDAIRRLNGIPDYTVRPGEELRLPTLK